MVYVPGIYIDNPNIKFICITRHCKAETFLKSCQYAFVVCVNFQTPCGYSTDFRFSNAFLCFSSDILSRFINRHFTDGSSAISSGFCISSSVKSGVLFFTDNISKTGFLGNDWKQADQKSLCVVLFFTHSGQVR